MKLGHALATRVQLRAGLAPQVHRALALLQLDAAGLIDELEREAARNPFLRLERAPPPPVALAVAEVAAAAPSLYETLHRQLSEQRLAAGVLSLAVKLMDGLRPDGYLDPDILDSLRAEGAAPGRLDAALRALQACDPPGVGARDLRECLSLQLRDAGLAPDAAEATLRALPALAAHDHARAAQLMGTDHAEAARRAALVRTLSPHPIAPQAADAPPLLPDLRVLEHPCGGLEVEAVRDTVPAVGLDAAMVARARTEGFALDHLARAEALLEALNFRGDTLLRIGRALLEHQHRFVTDGIVGLRPLTRRALAAELGLHPSTITRAVAGKSIELRGRLWPLAGFFSQGLSQDGEGTISATVVRTRLAALVAEEPPGKPRSDQALAALLAQEGVDIARRTVAKYRDAMRIPPAAQRRRTAPRGRR